VLSYCGISSRFHGLLDRKLRPRVERAGLSGLAEGQKLSFEIKVDTKRGKSSAEDLKVM
jgi:hypothetical protein